MDGLTKGFQLFTEFLALRTKVVGIDENEDARPEFDEVEEQWLIELTGAKTLAKAVQSGKFNQNSIFLAIGMGKDPFKTSRKMFQDLKAKYS